MTESFGHLLREYMDRTGIADAEMARTVGVSRQTVFRWKEGLVSGPRERAHVLAMANRLRLTPAERDRLLLAAGFRPEESVAPLQGAARASERHPFSGALLRRGALAVVIAGAAVWVFLAVRSESGGAPPHPRAQGGETLIVVGSHTESAAASSDALAKVLEREVRNLQLPDVRVAMWPEPLADAGATAALTASGAAAIAWVGRAPDGLTVHRAVRGAVDPNAPPAPALVADMKLAYGADSQLRAAGLWILAEMMRRKGDVDTARALVVQGIGASPLSSPARATLEAELRALGAPAP